MINAQPGNVSLASLLEEITKLQAVRGVEVPAGVFTGIGARVVDAGRARAAAASPSHLRGYDPPIRRVS